MEIGLAKKSDRKLRIGAYGPDSSGKTHLGLSAPGGPLAFDLEGIGAMTDRFGDIPIVNFNEKDIANALVDAAREMRAGGPKLADGTQRFGAFLIDSWTTIEKAYCKQLGFDKVADARTRISDLGEVRKRIEQDLLNPVLTGSTKCHIIVTAHEANVWGMVNGKQAVIGTQPDATRNFKHYFDIVFHMEGKTQDTRVATVVKSRFASLPIGTRINNLSWDHPAIKAILGGDTTIVPISNKELNALHLQAGAPNGKLGTWLQVNQFAILDGTISPEDTHRAKGMLSELIDEAAAAAQLAS